MRVTAAGPTFLDATPTFLSLLQTPTNLNFAFYKTLHVVLSLSLKTHTRHPTRTSIPHTSAHTRQHRVDQNITMSLHHEPTEASSLLDNDDICSVSSHATEIQETFPQFTRLPCDVQRMIWFEAIDATETIEFYDVEITIICKETSTDPDTDDNVPAIVACFKASDDLKERFRCCYQPLLTACYQSRIFGLEYLEPLPINIVLPSKQGDSTRLVVREMLMPFHRRSTFRITGLEDAATDFLGQNAHRVGLDPGSNDVVRKLFPLLGGMDFAPLIESLELVFDATRAHINEDSDSRRLIFHCADGISNKFKNGTIISHVTPTVKEWALDVEADQDEDLAEFLPRILPIPNVKTNLKVPPGHDCSKMTWNLFRDAWQGHEKLRAWGESAVTDAPWDRARLYAGDIPWEIPGPCWMCDGCGIAFTDDMEMMYHIEDDFAVWYPDTWDEQQEVEENNNDEDDEEDEEDEDEEDEDSEEEDDDS